MYSLCRKNNSHCKREGKRERSERESERKRERERERKRERDLHVLHERDSELVCLLALNKLLENGLLTDITAVVNDSWGVAGLETLK